MDFDSYKKDIVRHELGHWITSQELKFKTGDISIKILSNSIGYGHEATCKVYPNPDIKSLSFLYKYLNKRICVLYAGTISQCSVEVHSPNELRKILYTDAQDDYRKIVELLYIARGIRFQGKIRIDKQLEQKNTIVKECWTKAEAIINQKKETINLLVNVICSKIT